VGAVGVETSFFLLASSPPPHMNSTTMSSRCLRRTALPLLQLRARAAGGRSLPVFNSLRCSPRRFVSSRPALPESAAATAFPNSESSGNSGRVATPTPSPALQKALNETVFRKIRLFWFAYSADRYNNTMLPPKDLTKKWFSSDPEFDRRCKQKFGSLLELIKAENPTASDLLASVAPSNHLDWLSLILLLDQIPRNCSRGDAAETVFNFFDPLALQIAMEAIKQGIPENDKIRFRAGFRMWFYLPLQHSESRAIHEISLEQHASIFVDIVGLMEGNVDDYLKKGPAYIKRKIGLHAQRRFLLENREEVDNYVGMLVGFAQKHKDIIDRFGRYPHRNEVLGRESTEEEIKYLAEGGETFSSGS